MVTRSERISDFNTLDAPLTDDPAEILCEDHVGTYVLPFACRWREGAWFNAQSGEPIAGCVLGWRPLRQRAPTDA